MQKSYPKVLLVAENASAVFGGEALIPFHYFKRLRELQVDVHLLVHERTKAELESAFSDEKDRLHFIPDSAINKWCYQIGRFMPDRLAVFTVGAISHLHTQIRQRRMARALVAAHGLQIAHQPIPVSPKLPSLLFGLTVPVVFGPMNGGMDYPPHYNAVRVIERWVVTILRATSSLWNIILPGKRQAALLLVANKRTLNSLPQSIAGRPVIELVENGVDMSLFRPEIGTGRRNNGRFRIIFVGRLVDFKRVDLLIDACRLLTDRLDFEVDIVGDGPLRSALEHQTKHLGLENHVKFHGRLPQAVAADRLKSADVMVLPSMRECGGAVVLEAMASGVPVIAADWGGPADYITHDTGILVPPTTPEQFVQDLAKALSWLAAHPQKRAEMGEEGPRRVAALYDWGAKARAMLDVYRDVLDRTAAMKVSAQ